MEETGSKLSDVSSEVHSANGAQEKYRYLRIQFLWDVRLRHWVIDVEFSRQRSFLVFNSRSVRKISSGRQRQYVASKRRELCCLLLPLGSLKTRTVGCSEKLGYDYTLTQRHTPEERDRQVRRFEHFKIRISLIMMTINWSPLPERPLTYRLKMCYMTSRADSIKLAMLSVRSYFNKMVFMSQTNLFTIVLNVLFGRHVSTLYWVCRHVSVWDPITHLKLIKDLCFLCKGLMMTQ
jgi:hypothetical protein